MKRFNEFEWPWDKGPSLKYKDGIKRYRVTYRTRPRGELKWTVRAVEMAVPSQRIARQRVIQQCRERAEVDVMKVEEVSAEAPIQTGSRVQTVSPKEYERRQEETMEKTAYERGEFKKEGGLWVPNRST